MIKSLSLLPLLTLITISATAADPIDDLEGKQGYDRRAAITRFADTLWQDQRFSVDQGVDLLQGLSGSERYFATKSLFGSNRLQDSLLPQQLSANEIERLLEGIGDQRGEMIQYLADYGIPAPNLGVEEIQSLLGSIRSGHYERPLQSLLGNNRLRQNYGLPTFGVAEVEQLLSNSSDRAGMIRYFADNALLAGALTVEDAERMMGSEGAMARHDAVKALLGSNRQQQDYLTLPLQFTDAAQLIKGSALPEEMIRYFADHGVFSDLLSAVEGQQLLQGIHHTDRFNVVESLLGNNRQQHVYLQLPLKASDAVEILDGMAYRDEMIGLLSDQQALHAPLTPEEVLSLLGTLSRADRHDALSALIGNNEQKLSYLQLPIDTVAIQSLLEESAYRHELIQQMSDIGALQPLRGSDARDLLDELTGEARSHALASLGGDNLQQRHYFAQPMNSGEVSALLERSANQLALLRQLAEQQLIEKPVTPEALEQLLGRLYGEEREQAIEFLTKP